MPIPNINDHAEYLLTVDPNIITWLVVAFCVLLVLWCLIDNESGRRLRDIAPALMVSAGIFGTFWGTFIALAEFDVQPGESLDTDVIVTTIVGNIPMVLAGMQTAFVTTLIGLLFALVSKPIIRLCAKDDYTPLPIEHESVNLLKEIKEGITGEHSVHSQLVQLRDENRAALAKLDGELQTIKEGTTGEHSAHSQLVRLREENSIAFAKLDTHLDGLADTIRKSLVETCRRWWMSCVK